MTEEDVLEKKKGMDLETANKTIRNAVAIGIAMVALTAIVITVVLIFQIDFLGIGAFGYVDVAIELGLIYGLYRKSRTCAIILFAYTMLGKIGILLMSGNIGAIAGGVVVGYFLFQGIRGTFTYHRLAEPEQVEGSVKVEEESFILHSRTGFISFIMGLVLFTGILICIVTTVISHPSFNDFIIIVGLLLLLSLLISLAGAILGIVGVVQKSRKRVFSWLGLSLNGVFLLAFAFVIVVPV